MPAHGSFFQLTKIPSHGVNEAYFNLNRSIASSRRHHLLSLFPFKNRKETELEPKNTRQRTILAQIICHYVHLDLCSLDQVWHENIPGSFPFCNSSEGTRRPIIRCQAALSLLSVSEMCREVFSFLHDAFLESWTGTVTANSSLGAGRMGSISDLFGGNAKAFFRSGEK